MPDEIEVPTEHLHETLHEKAHGDGDPWLLRVALSAAMLSVLAAIAATVAGHYTSLHTFARTSRLVEQKLHRLLLKVTSPQIDTVSHMRLHNAQ